MIRRSTLIVLVLFVALAAAAYFLQRSDKQAAASVTPTESQPFLFSFNSEINGLQIEKVGSGKVELAKDAQGTWKLTTPPADATDTGKVESAISELMALRIVSKLDQPPSLEAAGLATPAYRVLINLQDKTQETMNIGKETPTGGNYYVQVSNRGIFIVSKYSLDPFLKLVDEPPILVTATPTPAATTTGQATEPAPGASATPAP